MALRTWSLICLIWKLGVTEHDCAIFKRSLLDQKWLITMSSWGGVDDVDDVETTLGSNQLLLSV